MAKCRSESVGAGWERFVVQRLQGGKTAGADLVFPLPRRRAAPDHNWIGSLQSYYEHGRLEDHALFAKKSYLRHLAGAGGRYQPRSETHHRDISFVGAGWPDSL